MSGYAPNTYTIRVKHDGGILAVTTTASTWTQAVATVLEAEGAPPSAFRNCYQHMREGEMLFNGACVSRYVAEAYNRVNDHIHAWEALGKNAPEQLLNGRHNLLASVQS